MLEPDFLWIGWAFGLVGSAFGLGTVYYIFKSYHNMKGGKFSKALQKIGIGNVFVILGMIYLGLRAGGIIPPTPATAAVSGIIALLAGILLFVGFRELNFLTEP